MKQLESERLILRKWEFDDSSDLYEYASDPRVGPNAGWSVHSDENESKQIIEMFRSNDENYAIVLKETNKVIGSISLHAFEGNKLAREIGYVLNPKYWGLGIVPEAVDRLKDFGFNDLNLDEIWCGHFDFNHRSKRVNEKAQFKYQYTKHDILERLDNKEVNTLMYRISKEEYYKSQSIQKP